MCPAERDTTSDQTLRAEAAIRAHIDRAVADADFSDSLPPDFADVTPDAHRVLTELANRTNTTAETRQRLAAALADLDTSAAPGGAA